MTRSNGTQPYSGGHTEATGTRQYLQPAVATLLLLVLLTLFVSAGRWQLGRAAEKEAIQESFDSGAGMEVLYEPLDEAAVATDETGAEEGRFRRLQLDGRYLPERQILLDNIVHAGVNGYEVLTPFATGDVTIMVNRGWVRANPDRRIVPEITVDGEQRTVIGIVNKFPAPGMRFATEYPKDAPWPRRMLYPDHDAITKAFGAPVASYQLLLTADQPDGYSRKWKALPKDAKQNYGYAFQWFSFAVLALVFYTIFIVRWRRANNSPISGTTPKDMQ